MLDLGRFPYIDTANTVIYVDGEAYIYSTNVMLKTAKGSIVTTTAANVIGDGTTGAIVVGDKVEVSKVVDGAVTELIAIEIASIDVSAVDTAIEALPAVADATIANAGAVSSAKGLYDALTPAEKDFVKAANVTKLNALVAKIAQLEGAADAAAVSADKEALTVTYNGTDATITLAAGPLAQGSAITWESDNAAINVTTKAVTRPDYLDGDLTVKLTATITKGDAKDTKVFTVVVKATTVLEDINGAADAPAMRALLEGLVKKGDFDAASSEKWNSLLGGQKDTVATNIYNAKESSPFTDFDDVKTLFATELGL